MWTRLAHRNTALLVKASEEITPAFAAFLSPIAAMALALGLWALCAQIAVASNFPSANGALADWRVWMLIAGGLEFLALRFRSQNTNSYARLGLRERFISRWVQHIESLTSGPLRVCFRLVSSGC